MFLTFTRYSGLNVASCSSKKKSTLRNRLLNVMLGNGCISAFKIITIIILSSFISCVLNLDSSVSLAF